MKQILDSVNICYVGPSELLVDDYLAMVNDMENVGRFIGERTEPLTREQELSWVRGKIREEAELFSMIEKASGEFIGNIELMNIRDAAGELGVSVTSKKQNRGYGQEAIAAVTAYAFDHLGLNRIRLKVFHDNARAIHVYEKCGFRELGREGRHVFMELVREEKE